MSDPWNFSGTVTSLGTVGRGVTLVEEATFAISDLSGEFIPGGAQGLFVQDTRVISRWEMLINSARPELLATVSDDHYSATFVYRVRPREGLADSTLMAFRTRYIGRGMREDLLLKNFGDEPAFCSIDLYIDADFANLFAVKEGRLDEPSGERSLEEKDGGIVFSCKRRGTTRGTIVSFSTAPRLLDGLATFEVIVPARGQWSICMQVSPVIDGKVVAPRYLCGQPVERAMPAERLARWRSQVPLLYTDNEPLRQAVARSAEDLGALRIFDPDYPDRMVLAAGAPWFMTVFGRDSIITSWMALMLDPDLALGVLQTLARFQGNKVDARNDEQPGRILHEMRFDQAASLSLGGGSIYYGTADATPLFVMLLGELRRWGIAREAVNELLPNADRAMEWIERYGDLDGDGYVEYQRLSDRGLRNQGWKDSFDGIRYANGKMVDPPIALCEVQGYVYSAYLARAYFAYEMGDMSTYERYRTRAAELKRRFNEDFWLDEHGWFAVGLDQDKKPIDSLASNMGHCLWTGIIDEEKAPLVAEKMLSDEMFTGWGIRTLASSMGGYNPISYHCGSVWPHDTAIAAAGLMRYGFVEGAHRLIAGLLAAAQVQGGRLPELFAGLSRSECQVPVAYPTSCSPQAWSAASPFLLLRSMLRLDPWIPYNKVWLAPALPEGIEELHIDRVPLAGARVSIEVSRGKVAIDGLPAGIELIREPRKPTTGAA